LLHPAKGNAIKAVEEEVLEMLNYKRKDPPSKAGVEREGEVEEEVGEPGSKFDDGIHLAWPDRCSQVWLCAFATSASIAVDQIPTDVTKNGLLLGSLFTRFALGAGWHTKERRRRVGNYAVTLLARRNNTE
jgi:hypothetical protein